MPDPTPIPHPSIPPGASPPAPGPFGLFNGVLKSLIWTLGGYICGNRLPNQTIMLINTRLMTIRRRIERIAERLRAGTYTPRRPAQARTEESRPPRARKPPLVVGTLPRHRNWLFQLMPEGQQYRAGFEDLFHRPEMVAALAEAPAAMTRPIRSLCWMLGVTPPIPAPPRPGCRVPPPSPPEPATSAAQPTPPKAPLTPPRIPSKRLKKWRGPTRCPLLPRETGPPRPA